MADLVTHIATALLVKAATRGPHTAALVVGVVLPDLAGRVPGMAASRLAARGVEVPELVAYGSGVFHMPLGMVALTLLMSLAFCESQRVTVWLHLLAGCALHLALDLTQSHVGTGYPLLFPFSTWHGELGLLGSEATTQVAPVLGPVAFAVWWLRRGQKGRADASGPDSSGA